jgi:hypothetical protein
MSLYDSLLDIFVVRKKKEGFKDSKESNDSDFIGFTTIGISILVLVFVYIVLYSYGAGRLSYCYSRSQGWSGGASFVWSLLSFFFSGFYYPYYALINSPSCSTPSAAPQMNYGAVGGRRGRHSNR